MQVRVDPSRSTMMYVNGELLPGSMTTCAVSTPSSRSSSRMAFPAPSSESLVRMEGLRPSLATAVRALPQFPPPCVSKASVRSFWSGFGKAAMDAR